MNVTPLKRRANRENAKRSTGPKTPQGKAAVRKNALSHGILAREVVIPDGEGKERQEDFDALLADLRESIRPEGPLEEMLVEKIAVCHWRLARVLRCERGSIRKGADSAQWRALSARMVRTSKHIGSLFMEPSSRVKLLESSAGLAYLTGILEEAAEEVEESGSLSVEGWRHLREHFGPYPVGAQREDGRTEWVSLLGEMEESRELGPEIFLKSLRGVKERLAALREAAESSERLEAEAETAALALPDPDTSDKLVRYERMLNRELYRAMRQLERLQRRRLGEAVPPPISIGS